MSVMMLRRLRRDSMLDQLTPEEEDPVALTSSARAWDCLKRTKHRLFSRCMKHERPETRIVRVGHRTCAALGDEAHVPEKHIDNRVISSKYTLLTFLPKNLFEQFRRIANFYFLVVGIIQLLIDTPVTPITSILPLVFVISVTAIKQGYEDWLRHKVDNEVNNRKSAVVEAGHCKDCKSMDIKVGDIVRVKINEEFPCDLVMLSSTDPEGKCYITTANLDGETNLKTHVCVPETRWLQMDVDFEGLEARIECEQPVADLYHFVGRMHVVQQGEVVLRPLGTENILLRGARLKNTAYVYGCAIHTGQETKVALNSKFKKTKFSRIERRMNTFLILFLVLLFVLSSLFNGLKHWYSYTHTLPSYIPPGKDGITAMILIEDFLAFMVLFNYVIPISLYVTVEVQKFVGSLFFSWDVDMYDEKTDLPALANTSDLNEELGQVEHLFTDKTGTLTENNMRFCLCSIKGRVYEEAAGQLCHFASPGGHPSPVTTMTDAMTEFFTVLALCHTVRVDNVSDSNQGAGACTIYSANGEDYDYHASSPDEKALVEACRRYGVIYHGVHDNFMEVTFQAEMRRYKVLHILDFTSARRCMSVIVQNEKGEIYLLCKGAEVSVFSKVSAEDQTDVQQAQVHIDQFAVLGLRTLAIAHRKFSPEEYNRLDALLREAKTSLQDREQKLHQVFQEAEQELTLLGVTAVEDKLQDQVPETITALRHAGIKVWVLTGDKEETAVNISHSTGHFHSGMVDLRLTNISNTDQCHERIAQHHRTVLMADKGEQYVLIVDGKALTFVLKDHHSVFLQLCQHCVAVLCCRMSPIQKAEVVRLIKHSKEHPVTAAIGDGANDISMIQEADVGLGIMGKEGRQAVQNSDYAFVKFRFLRRALLLHGHYYYIRLSTLVQYCFYKNVALITPQVLYQIFCTFSQQTLFDPFFLMFYNITFTSLPILIYGIFEQHLQRDKLLHKPSLYRRISRNSNMSWIKFIYWSMLGLWHGLVCFFGGFLLFCSDVSVHSDGKLYGLSAWGSVIHIAIVFVVNFKLVLLTYYWSWPIFAAFAFATAGNCAMCFVVTAFWWPSWATETNSFFWVEIQFMSSATVWLFFLVIMCIALLPDLLIRVVHDMKNHRSVYRPSFTDGDSSTVVSAITSASEIESERAGTSTYQVSLS